MGVLSFLKGVGEKVFGKDDKDGEVSPQQQQQTQQPAALKASALLNHIKKLGLPFNTLTVKTQGDTVILQGEVKTQEDAEKLALAVGNVEGVELVDNQLKVAEQKAESRFYTVKEGDSLSKISKEVYGDPMKYGIIFEANKPMLKDPDLIYPGQSLRIPQL